MQINIAPTEFIDKYLQGLERKRAYWAEKPTGELSVYFKNNVGGNGVYNFEDEMEYADLYWTPEQTKVIQEKAEERKEQEEQKEQEALVSAGQEVREEETGIEGVAEVEAETGAGAEGVAEEIEDDSEYEEETPLLSGFPENDVPEIFLNYVQDRHGTNVEQKEQDDTVGEQIEEYSAQKETEQEDTEQEDTEQEDTEQEDTEQEGTEQEETEQEDTEQEDTEQEETEQEETEQEGTEQEETEQEDTVGERVREETEQKVQDVPAKTAGVSVERERKAERKTAEKAEKVAPAVKEDKDARGIKYRKDMTIMQFLKENKGNPDSKLQSVILEYFSETELKQLVAKGRLYLKKGRVVR